jgi:AraC-like DNA-binding protein
MLVIIPALLILVTATARAVETDTTAGPRRLVTADSARIVSPSRPRVLEGNAVTVRVEPACTVSVVELLVRYYPWRVDTLARLGAPPYSATWHFAGLPDQDQLHLQFGYILYHPGGDTIESPPLPNNWVIDRDPDPSRRRFVCRRGIADSAFVIDGEGGEWKRFPATPVGDAGQFRCAWTAGQFFVAVEVSDPVVTPFDRVELMFDLKRQRTSFAGIDQRIISFGPKNRSFAWAVEPGNDLSTRIDSIIIRIQEEMEWRSRVTPGGYRVEARIPFCVLSDLEFPQKRMGFELCIVNRDGENATPQVTSWAGIPPAARHNPSEWGTLSLRQRMPALKVLLGALLFVALGIIALLLTLVLRGRHRESRYARQERQGYSPRVRDIVDHMEKHHTDPTFDITALAGMTGLERDDIREVLVNELETTCERMLEQMRVRTAKHLLRDSEDALARVADAAGFPDSATFVKTFSYHAGVPPDEWRRTRREEDAEEEEEEAVGGGQSTADSADMADRG